MHTPLLLGLILGLGLPCLAVEKNLPLPGEVFAVDGRTAFLIRPEKTATADRPLPWVWYAPTLRGLPGKEENWMFQQFLERGIAIAGIDVGESYGSPTGTAQFQALYEELTNNRGLAKQACLLGRSRGGLMLYNWAVEHPESVAGIAGIYPVCNLASYPGLARAAGAYKLTAEELKTQLTTHNPVDRLKPLAEAGVPIFHIHGDQDKVVPLEQNSGLVSKHYGELGGTMTLEVIEKGGHNMWTGWFQNQGLVDFLIARSQPPSQLATRLAAGEKQTLITYGTSLTAGGAWVRQVQEAVNKAYPEQATIINSGAGAMWSDWGVKNLDKRVIAKQPDTVLIEFGINDAFLEYKTSVAQARQNLETMIDRILTAHPDCEIIPMIMNPPIRIHLQRRPKIAEYYQMYREVARERGLRLVDHEPAWQQILAEDPARFDKLVPDGIHPAANGCAEVITPAILEGLGIPRP